MKKLYALLFALLLSIGMLVGCSNESGSAKNNAGGEKQTPQNENTAFPVTVKDAAGEKVTIKEKPKKIVSLIPSNTEIAFELGLGDKIVGVSDFDNYPKEAASKEKVGGQEMNLEKIISLKPDLVLAHASSAHNSAKGLKQLRDAGIAVLVVNDAKSIQQVYESIETIGRATGEKENADHVVKSMKEKIKMIQAEAAKIKDVKTVFVEVSPAPEIYTAGKNTFMDEMLSIINAKNAAGDLEGWNKIDLEAVVKRNPDVIVTTYGYYVKDAAAQVLNRKGWQEVNAVKQKRVVDVNSDIVTRSGPRLAEGVEELAKAVYPETFKK
ncbi:ABC transporter substrate-binding protein [Ectobacillus panaciterrae]|uniref:ABC transporter substrate-binding protein n=1 Tax=Ectobacillus panaciterrae TaxID=363872 RepID=UPI003CCB81B0